LDCNPIRHRPEYLSYLLRLWRVSGVGAPLWRGSLQRPGAAEPVGFADLEELIAFLRAETGADVRETTGTEAPIRPV
jgi:hypothetical protein